MITRLYATTNTKTNKLAGVIAHSIRGGDNLIEISAIGPVAVAVGAKAIFVAGIYLKKQLEFRVSIMETRSDSQELTATILEVRAQKETPITAEVQVIKVKSADNDRQTADKIFAYLDVGGVTAF